MSDAHPGGRSAVGRLFDETRRRLVETGTRNRLVHVNRANARGNVVNIVNERSDAVYAILTAGKTMRFRALGTDAAPESGELQLAAADAEEVGADRHTDNQLETRMGPDALAKRLLKIAREAHTAEEEQGVNILYLALGFLTWFEDKASSVARTAPLVLLPVELVRNARTSTYDVKWRDEDLITNLPLQQRLRDDFGIRLPEVEAGEDGWTPAAYFESVERIIADRARWAIDRDGIQLGFFSFSKLLMYRDLAIDAWPDGALEAHALTRGLLYEGFEGEPPLFGADDRLDAVLPPDKLVHVVDADASQTRVIEEVRSGRNLVVQGPPGTGKSQTITNIIAAAASEGKTVLFVAEKMAALSVVHDRLVKVGLRDICLELHSRSANKRLVHAEIARTLHACGAIPAMPAPPESLTTARDRLNAISAALHAPIGETGETAFSALGRQARYIGMGAPPPTLAPDGLAGMTRADERALCDALTELGGVIASAGPIAAHPLAGVGRLDLQPVELGRLGGELERAAAAATRLHDAISAAAAALAIAPAATIGDTPDLIELLDRLGGLPAGTSGLAERLLAVPDATRLTDGLASAVRWRTARDAADQAFIDAAFEAPVAGLRGALVAGASSFFARWGSAYRGASRELAGLLRDAIPKRADDRVALIDQLLAVQALRGAWRDEEAFLAHATGPDWRGERSDFAGIAAVATWCAGVRAAPIAMAPAPGVTLANDPARLAQIQRALHDALPAARSAIDGVVMTLAIEPRGDELTALAARFTGIAAAIDRYAEWARISRLRHRIAQAGCGALGDALAAGTIDGSAAVIELRFARAERIWTAAIAESPALRDLRDIDRHALAAEFTRLERARLKENVTAILARHLGQVPQGAQGEMGAIRSEIGKKTRHIALRQLFTRAPNALQRIKPVLLMSPISVAQYLPPGRLAFDLLVIDEASQVRPEDALGAIARARQIAVVGDQKQLPPTSFFDRLTAGDDEAADRDEDDDAPEDLLGGAAALAELESILSLCEARGLPSRMLQWHYRSRDPSLIRVSNREFYEDRLILPPSPLQENPDYGLTFTRVDGVYDKGGKRDNRIEGEALVARVADHARAHPDLSLGIVTFSSAQKNRITELLELARRGDAALDHFLREGQAEDVFVKNIENVQGDERDVILVSVGYGPTVAGGRPSLSFGPVNGEGGERRLNVLFTRARVRCEVFASFDPGDIDVSRAAREGPRILKRFLEFAKSGKLEQPAPTGAAADTPFEEDVAGVIRSFGYIADPQVGSAGFRIDIGVRHPDKPGTYIVAVECDGATYHSALWARERDRLRQDVLEHLGWRFHRIWSTDWFHDRRAEIDRLRATLADAREQAEAGPRIDGANRGRRMAPAEPAPPPAEFVIPQQVVRTMPAYTRALFPVRGGAEPHEAHPSILAPLALKIVEAEGPIHIDEVARRIASSFGKERAGPRIVATARLSLAGARRIAPHLQLGDDFWWTDTQAADPPVRDRSAESGATQKPAMISLIEIRRALAIARDDNAGGNDADLIRIAARLLGFRRVGPELQARLREGLGQAGSGG